MNKETNLPRPHEAFQIVDDLLEDGDTYHRLCGCGSGYPTCNGYVFVFDGESFQCQKCGEKLVAHPCEVEEWTYQYVTASKH